ncbi:MAG: Druantia anti-phage system protein DruA [Actinomycetota bacterium]
MDDTVRVFSGRTLSPEDIELIKWARKAYPKLPRHEFAGTVCELLNWTTSTGRAKWHPCLAFLEQLEEEGQIQLPSVKAVKPTTGKVKITAIEFDKKEINGEIRDFEPIQIAVARPGEELNRWRSYIEQYHMLKFKTVFGSRLQYFVKSGDLELGCIQFSASSWALEERDKWIGWTVDDRKARLNLIVNNSRYLIFPWVHIRNLASKALSLAAKQIQEDWLREFYYAPVLLETFVDLEHFRGTCYKAANWTYLGETKGRGRMDRHTQRAVSKKAIFMYPLQDDFKAVLKGEKPCKAVNPDE